MPLIFPSLRGLTWPRSRKNTGFGGNILESISGKKIATISRSQPIYQWKLSFDILSDKPRQSYVPFSDNSSFSDQSLWSQVQASELQELNGFYNQCYGSTFPFWYKEPSDYMAVNTQFAIGDGVTNKFQLTRVSGGFYEVVKAVNSATVKVYVNHELTPVTILDNGIVQFFNSPKKGASLSWSGEFYWVCRFDHDGLDFSQFMINYWELKSVTFSSEI